MEKEHFYVKPDFKNITDLIEWGFNNVTNHDGEKPTHVSVTCNGFPTPEKPEFKRWESLESWRDWKTDFISRLTDDIKSGGLEDTFDGCDFFWDTNNGKKS